MKLKELLHNRELEKINELITNNPEVLDEKDENGTSAIVLLAYYGLYDLFQKALQLKKNFDFHEAIVCGKADIVKDKIAEDPTLPNKYSDDGFAPVSLAAFFDRDEIVEILLDAGGDPNLKATNAAKVNALHSAVARENLKVSRMLIDKGVDVNATQAQDVTALHSAAHRGNLDLVKLLIEAGADQSLKMQSGETAADLAAKDGHSAVQKYLEELN